MTKKISSMEAKEAFDVLANVLGATLIFDNHLGSGIRKQVGAEVTTLSLRGEKLRAERRRGNSSVVITSDATMDGAYGVFCELAPKIAAANERYVRVLNQVENAGVDPADVVTCVSYLYRDANNYEQAGRATFLGPASRDSVNAFLAMLDSEGGPPSIIPGQVGMDDLQDRFTNGLWDEGSDHPFHEVTTIELLNINVMSEAEANQVGGVSFDAFVKSMFATLGAAGGWDQNYRPPFAARTEVFEPAVCTGCD